MTFNEIKNSKVRKLSKDEQKQIKATPSEKKQGCFLLVLALVFFSAFCANAQTARIDDRNFITKSETAPTVYHATVQVSKKKAVRLLCEQIKSRQNTTVLLPRGDLKISYNAKVYSVTTDEVVFENTKVSEVRKFCKSFIENIL